MWRIPISQDDGDRIDTSRQCCSGMGELSDTSHQSESELFCRCANLRVSQTNLFPFHSQYSGQRYVSRELLSTTPDAAIVSTCVHVLRETNTRVLPSLGFLRLHRVPKTLREERGQVLRARFRFHHDMIESHKLVVQELGRANDSCLKVQPGKCNMLFTALCEITVYTVLFNQSIRMPG